MITTKIRLNYNSFQRDPLVWYQCIHFVDSQDGKISYEEFEHMCTIFPKVFNPIRQLLFRISPTTYFIFIMCRNNIIAISIITLMIDN